MADQTAVELLQAIRWLLMQILSELQTPQGRRVPVGEKAPTVTASNTTTQSGTGYSSPEAPSLRPVDRDGEANAARMRANALELAADIAAGKLKLTPVRGNLLRSHGIEIPKVGA